MIRRTVLCPNPLLIASANVFATCCVGSPFKNVCDVGMTKLHREALDDGIGDTALSGTYDRIGFDKMRQMYRTSDDAAVLEAVRAHIDALEPAELADIYAFVELQSERMIVLKGWRRN